MIAVLTILVVIGFIVGGYFLMDRLDRFLGNLGNDEGKCDKMQEKKGKRSKK